MKKFYCYLYVLLAALITISCEQKGEFIDIGYYSASAVFIYPEGVTSNYDYTFNGNSLGLISRNNPTGVLEVIEKDGSTVIFSQEVNLSDNVEFQFIQNPGQPVELYIADDYITINNAITYLGTGEGYATLFNGQELSSGKNYYKKANGLPGQLEIYQDGNETPVYSSELDMDENDEIVISLVQLEAQLFLDVPEDTEPDPELNNISKLRFFYTSSALPGVDRIKLIVYDWNDFDNPKAEIEMNVGELSSYVTIDWSTIEESGGLCQDIINVETDEKIVDSYVNLDAYIDALPGYYKKATMQIGDGGVVVKGIAALSTTWN
jgi:hypothetical protein